MTLARRSQVLSFLAAILFLVTPWPAYSFQNKHRRPPKPVGLLRKDLSRVKAKKQQVRAKLQRAKRQVTAVVADIHVVDSRLGEIEDSLADTSSQLDHSLVEQKATNESLVAMSEQLAETKERVQKRLRRMYMQGNSTLLAALLGSTNIGDLASRQLLLQRIAEKDRSVFNQYRDLRAQVAQHKRRVDQLVVRVSNLQASQQAEEAQVEDARRQKQGYLRELKGQVADLQDLLNQYEQDEQDIESQINEFELKGGTALPRFAGRLSKPVDAPITSGFGMRYHPILHIRRLHAGIDFGASYGTPIRAAADGIVIAARQSRTFGNVIILDHGGGISTVYAHCSRLFVTAGQHVIRGQRIGAVGATGLATGPHLHFEVHVNGKPVNPLSRL